MTQTILDRNRTLCEPVFFPYAIRLFFSIAIMVTLSACGGSQNSLLDLDTNMDKITEYSQTSGESDPPTIDDYINLGINTVTEDNISTINTALAEQNNIETITELQTVIDQVLTQQTAVASFELGAQLYADNCSLCHMPLASTDKPNRSVLSLTSAITVIPQMQFLQLNDVELESLEIALSGNTEVVSCEVETIAPRLSRLTPSQYDNTVQTFIPDVVTNPSDDFVSSLSSGRFSTDNSVLSMSTPHVSQLIDVSDTLAELLVAKPETLAACTNSDGDFGDVIISGNGSSASTTIDFDSISAQYIRIEQVGSASNGWGIGDLNIFNNGIAIDRSDWELEASDNIAITDLAIDNTDTTRWVTSVSQAGGEWVTIDLGSEQTFDQIILNQRPKNASAYPRAYEIRIASDAIETGISESECEDLFFNELLTRAFRRPIESEELAIYRGFYESSRTELALSEKEARKLAIQRVLLSPDFLFRTELGEENGLLGSYELASAVSYLISDSPPDEALYAAAENGTLANSEVLQEQAERLLSQRSTGAGIETFFKEHLTYNQVQGVNKDETLFPEFDENLTADAMVNETQEFIAHVLWEDDGKLSTLLSAPYSLLNENNQHIYGVSGLSADFERVDLGPERGGILTQPSLLARFATNEESDIVHRGQYVAEEILCRVIPEPPEGVADSVVNIDTSTPITQRQVIEQHSSDPLCASCHVIFDDFGTVLESFDAVGAFRDQVAAFTFEGSNYDQLLPVNPVVDLLNLGPVNSSAEMVSLMAESDEALACFSERITQYTFGGESNVAHCEQEALIQHLETSGGDMKAAILSLITSANFQQRVPRGQE